MTDTERNALKAELKAEIMAEMQDAAIVNKPVNSARCLQPVLDKWCMKLIDGHAMIQRVEALHKRGAVDLSYYNIVKEAVQMEPVVDAIPVEWIRNIKGNLPESIEKMGLDAVLILWAQEQEVR